MKTLKQNILNEQNAYTVSGVTKPIPGTSTGPELLFAQTSGLLSIVYCLMSII